MSDKLGPAEPAGDGTPASSEGSGDAKADRSATPERAASYREVFASTEYRAVFGASVLSWVGDYLARVAVAFLVFDQTKSVLLSALAFAMSYLPWAIGGPLLAAVAERYPYRKVMILCDLGRMGLVALLAVPGVPLPLLLVLLLASTMLTPPFDAARSAMLPQILTGDRYVVGLSLQNMSGQAAQVLGYVGGGAASAVNPRFALLLDAATFGVSALLLWRWVRPRPPALAPTQRTRLTRETAEGFRVVFGNRVLRAIALLVFPAVMFSIVPEGLAAPWASHLAGGDTDTGVGARIQGLLMAANPVGVVIGGFIVGRLLSPSTRQRLIRPLALLAPLALVPALLDPPVPVVLLLVAITGFAMSCLIPLNGLFVQVLPSTHRARAFGVMQGGIQILQGVAVLATGAIGERVSVPTVVGAWSVIGVLFVLVLVARWPSQEEVDAAIADAQAANQAAEGGVRPTVQDSDVDLLAEDLTGAELAGTDMPDPDRFPPRRDWSNHADQPSASSSTGSTSG